MSQLILMASLSASLLGTCGPSIDQEARLAKLRETLAKRQAVQVEAAAGEQAAQERAREANRVHLADLADETWQGVRRMRQLITDMETRLKAYREQVDRPENDARYLQMLRDLDRARSNLEKTRTTWKRMAEG